ncbi:hypothetical protein [Halodesulfovibrio aestuarii]|uniref:hypothetical protein n=1 Tax=Halodesulfovibrio aestuarii TaxID=126333 RepID=UPI000487B293
MDRVGQVRIDIYNFFHSSEECQKYFFEPKNADEYARYYTSMYLIQDTIDGVQAHIHKGFSDDSSLAYIELCGVMQAIFIQQDSISTLVKIVKGEKLSPEEESGWQKIRTLRNQCVGHPGNQGRKYRSFFGRFDFSYAALEYERKDRDAREPERINVNLEAWVRDYAEEAAGHLSGVLEAMRSRWSNAGE